MRRHCGRPGCNAVATATFSFDATRCVVWLNPIEDGMPRAGDLCTRHADGMAPPKNWERIDHRVVSVDVAVPIADPNGPAAALVTGEPATAASASDDLLPAREPAKKKRKPAAKKRWHEVPNLFEAPATTANSVDAPRAAVAAPAVAETAVVEPAVETPADEPTSWMPRYATDEDLGDVLDASTPLLARAFNHARPSGDSPDDASDDASDDSSEAAGNRSTD